MAKDPVSSVVRTRPSAMVSTKPPPPPQSGAVKLVKKATERLEEDAKEMEDRLVQLRLSMLEEKKKRDRELPVKHGGSRWRSAREDRGSVSNYAQDVQNKAKTTASTKSSSSKNADAKELKPSTAKAKKKKRGSPGEDHGSVGILSAATVSQWSTLHVLEWLAAIGLEEYQSGFEYHQVTGATLLQVTMDELAQIGVVKLSARNTLYNEIEKIRAKSSELLASGSGSQGPRNHYQQAEIIDPKLHDVSPEVHSPQSKTESGGGGVHWSQVKPLSETTVALGNGDVPVNLADGDFNEDESHASFMKALLEWRSTDNDQAQDDQSEVAGDKEELWVNPMLNMFLEKEATEVPQGGGALLDGCYDEEKEQEAFRRAVEAWRTGSLTTFTLLTTPSVAQLEQGCTTTQRKSCWQCYQVVNVDSLLVDEQTSKPFCSAACQSVYRQEYARFYRKQ